MAPHPSRRLAPTEWVGLALLVILYLIIAAAHAYLAPLTTGPDELAHYEYLNFIAEQGRLPLTLAERAQASYKSDQPPLYHLLAAWPAALVDTEGPPFLKRVTDHERRQLIERTRHAWGLYNTQDEQWPYRGEVLRWHIGRWIAILFGAGVVAATYFLAQDVFGWIGSREQEVGSKGAMAQRSSVLQRSPHGLALATAAVVAFIPRFALTGSMLNYETLQALVSTLFLWLLLRVAAQSAMSSEQLAINNEQLAINNEQLAINNEQSTNPTLQPSNPPTLQPSNPPILQPSNPPTFQSSNLPIFQLLLLGLLAGLAITVKLSALILPLVLIGGLALISHRCGWSWSRWTRAVSVAAIGLVVGAGWWFGFVLVQFNTIAQDGWWTGLLRPLIAADASDATTNRLLSALTGGEAGFAAPIDNLSSGPPWVWAATFFRTFWAVGIEEQQPLGWAGLVVALLFCLLAIVGLIKKFKIQNSKFKIHHPPTLQPSNPPTLHSSTPPLLQSPNLPTFQPSNFPLLLLTLLLLHLTAAFILPLIRYATTFSLADTAQGRHVLFLVGPAFAILLVWGLTALANFLINNEQLIINNEQLAIPPTFQPSNPPILQSSNLPTFHSSILPFFLLPTFLLFWTLTQLYTMTWAYLPPLPVWTVAQNAPGPQFELDRRLTPTGELIGYDRRLDGATGLLQVDLLWQATQVSRLDYLTQVTLFDAQGQAQSLWQGHPAAGRYPTRAWDPGDLVLDTVWLPTAGLAAGTYSLGLTLEPTAADNPLISQVAELPDQPLILGQVELPSTASPSEAALPDTALAAGDFTIWQNGRPLTEPSPFRYRETILVTFNGEPPPALFMANADQSVMAFPGRHWDRAALFMVGPTWSTGTYQLFTANTKAVSPPLVQVTDRWERSFVEPAISHRLEANFANQVKLLGYELAANRVEPGGGLPVTLYWQGLDWMGQSYTIFAKLLAADQTVHGGRDRLPQEGYRTIYWAPAEIVTDSFGVPVEADAPAGVYYLNLGLYYEVAGQALSLPLVENGQPIDASSVTLGPIKVGRTPPEFVQTEANPQVALDQPFGNAPHLTLLGFDIQSPTKSSDPNPPTLRSSNLPIFQSSTLSITLYWRSESPLPLDYTTFLHLSNSAGDLVAQRDQPPLKGAYPTSLWDPGEIIADQIDVPLPAELSPGRYELRVGLYDPHSDQRLPIPDQADNSLPLLQLELE